MITLNFDRIAVVGDWHQNTEYALDCIRVLNDAGIKVIVHTGDYGLWSRDSVFIKSQDALLSRFGMILIFVDGNHEDHRLLATYEVDPVTGFRKIAKNILHAPRGHRWKFGDSVWMGFGGAASVDRGYREEGFDWFPEECITDENVEYAKRAGTVNVMVCHDAPYNCGTLRFRYGKSVGWPEVDIARSNENQMRVEEVMLEMYPKVLFHGHHHFPYTDFVGSTKIVGLDCDGSNFSANAVIVDNFGERTL